MPRLKATSRSACSESFGKMYVLAVNPSPPNPMGSVSDDWVQDGIVGSLGCMMFIVTQSTSVKQERQMVVFENLTFKIWISTQLGP